MGQLGLTPGVRTPIDPRIAAALRIVRSGETSLWPEQRSCARRRAVSEPVPTRVYRTLAAVSPRRRRSTRRVSPRGSRSGGTLAAQSWAQPCAREHRRRKLHDDAHFTRRARYRRVDATGRARAVDGVEAHAARCTDDRREAEAAAAAPTGGADRRAGGVGLGGRGGCCHGGRGRRRDGARSWPWTARHVPCWTHAQALVHTSALDAGVEGARVAVVAAARAGARSDARRKICRARGAVVLRRRGAPAETAGPVGRGPAASDVGPCPGRNALRAGGEVAAATVQEGARARPWGRERRARPEAVVMGAVAGIRGAAELVHAVAFAGPQARRRHGRATVLLAGQRRHPRRLKTGLRRQTA
jgi:hypothetical protein